MTGAELLARVAETSPDTARILLTGYADIEAVIDAVNQGQIVHYITKPWDADKLLALLKPIAERHALLQENRKLIRQLAEINMLSKDAAAAPSRSWTRCRTNFKAAPWPWICARPWSGRARSVSRNEVMARIFQSCFFNLWSTLSGGPARI